MPRLAPGYTGPVNTAPSPADRKRLGLLLVPFALTTVVNTAGIALAPALLVKAPLLLVALSPLGRHLLMASPSIDLLPFLAVAAPRMFFVDPFMYVLGRDFGELAVEALSERLGPSGGAMLRRLDGAMRKMSWLLVLLWPDPLVCTLAGVSRLRPSLFVALNLLGTFGMLALVRVSSHALSGPVGWLRSVLENNTLAATTVSVAVVLGAVALRFAGHQGKQEQADLQKSPGDS